MIFAALVTGTDTATPTPARVAAPTQASPSPTPTRTPTPTPAWTPTPTPTLLLERQVVVPPKESHEIRFDIDRDSMLACTITVSGGNNDIDIRILDADRQPILYEPRLAGTNTVRVSIPGGQQYWLVLDNSFSSRTQKRVQVRCVATPP